MLWRVLFQNFFPYRDLGLRLLRGGWDRAHPRRGRRRRSRGPCGRGGHGLLPLQGQQLLWAEELRLLADGGEEAAAAAAGAGGLDGGGGGGEREDWLSDSSLASDDLTKENSDLAKRSLLKSLDPKWGGANFEKGGHYSNFRRGGFVCERVPECGGPLVS